MLLRARVEQRRACGGVVGPALGGARWRAPSARTPDHLGSAAAVGGTSYFICAVDDLGFVYTFYPGAGLGLGGPAQLHRDHGDAELADCIRQPVAVRQRLRAPERVDGPWPRNPARPAHPR